MLIETARLESTNRAAAVLLERFASRTALVVDTCGVYREPAPNVVKA
jgi:hypothetical protein